MFCHRLGPELGITFQLPAAYIRCISTPEARNAKWDLADLIIGLQKQQTEDGRQKVSVF